jgi:WD40 repeat protein
MAAEPSPEPRSGDDTRRFAWISVSFGAVIVGGFVLVLWAVVSGRSPDVAASPYHAPLYLGLAALVGFCLARVIRAVRGGVGWRRAFPDGFGLLGVGAAASILGLVLDVGWREGVGINFGIEDGFAPSRVVLVIALGMIAIVPLRAATLLGARRIPRVAAAISASLTLAALGWPGGFNVAASPWLAVDPDLPPTAADLWVMDADGGHQTRLVELDGGDNAGYASWSPDGSLIAYTVFGTSGDDAAAESVLWTVLPDGTEAARLDDSDEWRWIPRVTPDGEWVLYTQEAAGGPFVEEGPVGPGAAAGPQGPLSVPLPHADIWRMEADGSGDPERLTDQEGDDRAPVPSPDGTLVLFDTTRDGNTELYVMNADGADPRRLTDDPGEDWGGSWSPDGTSIAFNSTRSGAMEIYVMDADGSNVRQVTFDGGLNTSPSWSPDGERLVFTSRDPSNRGTIRSVAVGGGATTDLSRSATTGDQSWTGAWGPDGRIVFARSLGPVAEDTPLARLDLGTATMLLSAGLVAAVVVLLTRTAPVPGTYTAVLTLAMLLLAAPTGEWRFVPAGIAAGIAADLAAWLGPSRLVGRLAGATAASVLIAGAALMALATTGLVWSPTLAIGVAMAAGAVGWGMGAIAEAGSSSRVARA